MSWDPSYVDPTDRPGDALIIKSVGTRTGPLELENGATLKFPWKRQQQAGLQPASIRTVEIASSPSDFQRLEILGPKLSTAGSANDERRGILRMQSAYGGNYNQITLQAQSPDGANLSYLDLEAGSSGSGLSTSAELFANGPISIFASGGDLALVSADVGGNGGSIILTGDVLIGAQPITGAWTSYLPTIVQGVTVSKTTTYARYIKVGRKVTFAFLMTITSSGTSGQTLTITVPFTAAQAANLDVGQGHVFNGATNVSVPWTLNTTSTIAAIVSGGFYNTQVLNTHAVSGTVTYEAAT